MKIQFILTLTDANGLRVDELFLDSELPFVPPDGMDIEFPRLNGADGDERLMLQVDGTPEWSFRDSLLRVWLVESNPRDSAEPHAALESAAIEAGFERQGP